MRYSASEKLEIIRLVEQSELPVKYTLNELDIPTSTFYDWYHRYLNDGYDGLICKRKGPRRFWNRIPDHERKRIVDIALEHPEKSPRELAWHITDTCGYFVSESSVYRILKSFDLIPSPNYILISAADKFKNPTRRIHQLWQTDFTYFKVVGWGWYYLTSVLDDYSRYIIAWQLCTSMKADDVKEVLDKAISVSGVTNIPVKHRPRLLSDNGPCYVSNELAEYLGKNEVGHIRGRPFHPQTQGKIERYHRTMKNVITLQNFYFPWELEEEIRQFIDHYNHERYHEALENVTPADVYYGRKTEILTKREKTKRRTLKKRKQINLNNTNQRQTKKSLIHSETIS